MPQKGSAAPTPFVIRDCALITRATGLRGRTLEEFRQALASVPEASIYHHFWGRLLRPQFDEPEYNNDFASWVWRALHDKPLAERLSMAVPTDFENLEALREELLGAIDLQLQQEPAVRREAEHSFHFLESQIVIFDAGLRFERPVDLLPFLSFLSTGSVYFHFIDARSRTAEHRNDFSLWLEGLGEEFRVLTERLDGIDPYFSSLKEMRHLLERSFQLFFEERS